VTDTGVVDLDADLVGPGGSDFDVLEAEFLAGLPGDGSLAGDGLCRSNKSFPWLVRNGHVTCVILLEASDIIFKVPLERKRLEVLVVRLEVFSISSPGRLLVCSFAVCDAVFGGWL